MITLCTPPICECLNKATDFITERHGIKPNWFDVNDTQKEFLELVHALHVSMPELKSIADIEVNIVNRWARDHGFDIQLDEIVGDPFAFYAGSIFDLLIKWSKPGTKRKLEIDGKDFQGARVTDHFGTYYSWINEVCSIRCENGDVVYMMEYEDDTDEALDLLAIVKKAEETLTLNDDYKAVVFPAVKVNDYPNISWIEGLTENNTLFGYYIAQALQQTKFQMDHEGAHVESCVLMGLAASGCCMNPKPPKPDFVIDKRFVVWIKREGYANPLFIGHFDKEHWVKHEAGPEDNSGSGRLLWSVP
jgi:hypothetical protein